MKEQDKKTFNELQEAILEDKTIKSEYAQASIVILRNIFTDK